MTDEFEAETLAWKKSGRAWLWTAVSGILAFVLMGVWVLPGRAGKRKRGAKGKAKTVHRSASAPRRASGNALYRYQSHRCARRWRRKLRSMSLAKERLPLSYERLKPLHYLKCAPNRGDWLASQYERGETFKRYRKNQVNRPNATRKRIYIMPLGTFSPKQRKILQRAAEYTAIFFSVPVKLMPFKKLKGIPRWATRRRFGSTQLLSTYMLKHYLPKRRPKDAVATIAFTSRDLWPGRGWNFVYGEAALYRRIGVWSLYRMGDPSKSAKTYRKALRRTIKIAVHELGHIFTITHCIAYQCVMNGAMHMNQVDRGPIAMCPVCLRKLCWNTRCDAKKRFTQLAHFWKKQGLAKEHRLFQALSKQWAKPQKAQKK